MISYYKNLRYLHFELKITEIFAAMVLQNRKIMDIGYFFYVLYCGSFIAPYVKIMPNILTSTIEKDGRDGEQKIIGDINKFFKS